MTLVPALVALALTVGAPEAGATRTSTRAPTLPPLAVGELIPTWRQPVVNAARWGSPSVELRAFYERGARATERVVVTFGASWCAPCKAELAALSAARDTLAALDARVVVVVVDREAEGRDAMVRWLTKELDVPFGVVVDELGILARRYRAEALPASFVADANGVLAWSKSGYDAGTVDALLELLRALRAPR